ncbi:2-phospho-L-lactate guanylyltransferase [Nakamurella sp. GG22]
MQPSPTSGRWTIVVPLKSSARGKSRLDVDPVLRRRLAVAMAQDTVAAAAAARRVRTVLVVAEDPADAREMSRIAGVRTLLTGVAGLNESIVDGLRALSSKGPVAVIPGDLPSLVPEELDDALLAAGPHGVAVVADRQGTGTTLLAAATADRLRPRYGAGSFARHVASGAVPLELSVTSGLRRDVDLPTDLAGVTGAGTLAVLAGAGCGVGLCAARPTG